MIHDVPQGGSTGLSHEHTEAVILAAQWLCDEQNPPSPIIPSLKARFGLNSLQASEACGLAQKFRTVRRAFA